MRISAHFNAQRLPEKPLERLRVAAGGPKLELGIAARANLQQPVLAAIVKVDARHRLRMAPVEALGQTQDRRQRSDDTTTLPRQGAVPFVAPLRRGLAMIPRDQRNRFDLLGIEAA
jgi:hypothetical protein